jgi:hypothetical protein
MIMINQVKNLEGLRHKEERSLPGMQIYFVEIVFIVISLDTRFQNVGIIKEMFKKEVPMWSYVTLSVKNVITMDT